jgi:acetyl-CoA acetyltransferase
VCRGRSRQAAPHPDDAVIVCAVRTPICKAKKGGLKDTPAEDLLATVLAAVVEKTKVDPALFGDVVVGSVLGSNVWRANQARIAMFLAGYPDTVRALLRHACLPARRAAQTTLAALATRTCPQGSLTPRCATQVPVRTMNRQCSSGLQAVADVASAIKARLSARHPLYIHLLLARARRDALRARRSLAWRPRARHAHVAAPLLCASTRRA